MSLGGTTSDTPETAAGSAASVALNDSSAKVVAMRTSPKANCAVWPPISIKRRDGHDLLPGDHQRRGGGGGETPDAGSSQVVTLVVVAETKSNRMTSQRVVFPKGTVER